MKILGIHDGHLSTASLLVDGRIVAMASEERITRTKNQGGPPEKAIGLVLRESGIRGADLNVVALATLAQPLNEWEDNTNQARRKLFRVANAFLPTALVASRALVGPYLFVYRRRRDWKGLERALTQNDISPQLHRIERFEHHACHAATAYYLSWFRDDSEPMLIVTVDGSGDGLCATISVGHRGRLERLHAVTSYHSLGELYTRVTELLGMKPLDHEYKVMGLAPYAPAGMAERAYRIFASYYRPTADGLSFENRTGVWGPDLGNRMARDLRGIRFDAVAAGVQRLLEELISGFVLAWVRKTGLRTVGVAGGVFMNVKLNMLLSESPEIGALFLMPSCGDESIALGAALLAYADHRLAQGLSVDVPPLDHLYFGPEYSRNQILADLEPFASHITWTECEDIETTIARRLAEGQILGRLAGRMEWGARSLGNRAILADPRDLRNVRRLNMAVKMRDFWMPFAPSILEERSADYLVNPRRLRAPYMINAFRSTPLAQQELICGLHLFDLSCRPQLVTPASNPRYHRLIQAFQRITGVGGILNTSFNLHGEPIVCRPADAVYTLLNSGLDGVAIEKFLIRKKAPLAEILVAPATAMSRPTMPVQAAERRK